MLRLSQTLTSTPPPVAPPGAQVALYINYPRTETPFNLSYYLKSHIPLCRSEWGAKGLLDVDVATCAEGPTAVVCTLFFSSPAALGEAMKSEGTPKIMADAPNYTSGTATMSVGTLVAQA